MFAIVSLLLVVVLSLLVTRTAAVALTYTGLPQEAARFQARSAFSGVGYTTSESESIVNHPVRRRIVMLLMLGGNAGIVTAVSSLILSFVNTANDMRWGLRLGVIAAGLAVIFGVSQIPWVDRKVRQIIEWSLKKWTDLDARDYAQLLCLAGDYGVSELAVEPGDWLAHKLLAETKLDEEGLSVLGIHRADGSYLGVPDGTTRIQPGDRLVLYGRSRQLAELDCRCAGPEGDRMHRLAREAVRQAAESSGA